jgi:hypothetical protein
MRSTFCVAVTVVMNDRAYAVVQRSVNHVVTKIFVSASLACASFVHIYVVIADRGAHASLLFRCDDVPRSALAPARTRRLPPLALAVSPSRSFGRAKNVFW